MKLKCKGEIVMVQTIDGKFKEKWQIVEKEFEEIKKNKLLPFVFTNEENKQEELKQETIEDDLKKLKETKFTVSVCGVVKAGKSTFLNSLFFEKNVLPAFDTPLTAKLTFIEYTDSKKDYFTATFYTEKEWDELYKNLKDNDRKQYEQLNERIDISGNKQVIKENLFSTTTAEQYNLDDLKYYVSDPKTSDGKYTPFVKYVNVYINNENIRNIRIVDTPGLNDSNIINSRETIKWIGKTHALIFLLRNKGIDSSDLQFFTAHLSQTKPESRIFVINKIDDLNPGEADAVHNHLKELGKSEKYRQKGELFGERETICKYSGLISLLQKKFKSGLPLDEDEQYHLEGNEDFNPDPDNILDKISTKLFNNEGKLRFDSGVKTVSQIYERIISEYEKQKIEKEVSLENYNKDLKKLEDEINKEEEIKYEIESAKEEIKDNVENEINKSAGKMNDGIDFGLNKIRGININKYESLDSLKKEFPFDFEKVLNQEFSPHGKMTKLSSEFSNKINGSLKESMKELKKIFQKHEIVNKIIFHRLDSSNNSYIGFNNEIYNKVKQQLEEKLPSFFGNLFCTHESNKNTAYDILGERCREMKDKFDIIIKEKIEQAQKCVDNNFKFIEEQISNSIQEKKDLKEKNKEEKEKQKEILSKEIKELSVKIENIKQKQREFKKQCERL